LFSGDFNNVVRVMLYRLRSIDPVTSASTITGNIFPVGDAITAIPDADDVAEVYFDKTVSVRTTYGLNSTGTGTATQTQWQAYLHESLKLDVPMTFINTGAANIEENMILLSAWSDSTLTPAPSMSASFRVLFEDL